ncbi:MAG: S4 domain-containing protein YaaA [Bacilli bacterium]|nr:S4 domain-containing protein YaaA [Bacilli bacterium]
MSKKSVLLKPDQEFMTLNVLLKITGIIDTGGMAKAFLAENPVLVNKESENRRGRKLYRGDVIEVLDDTFVIE